MKGNKVRLCNIYNTPSHYRKPIYLLLDETFDSKFVFGDAVPSVKRFDIRILKDASALKYRYIGKLCFMPGMLKYLFKKYNTYIITPETNNVSMWLFLICAKLFPSKKVYTWTHGMYGYESKRQLFFKTVLYKLCDGDFVYGDYAIELMKKRGFDSNRLFPIHNSLDYDTQLLLRKNCNKSDIYINHFNNNHPVLLFIGRLTKIKKLQMILDAVYSLVQQDKHYNIVFVGDGSERQVLERKAKELGLTDNVWFYGACYDEEENARLIYNADLCVSPGNVGLTAIHSLTFGTPVLTHDNFTRQMPEFETIKDGVTGSFFLQDNTESLARQIDNWFQKNRNNRDEIRAACYEVIDSEWNPYYQIDLLKKVFDIK